MSLVYFSDRDLGRQFPETLSAAGLKVERHQDHFPQDCADEDWLRVAGELGWVVLTHNRRIRYTPNELAAVKRHRVALLIIVGKDPFPVLAQSFVRTASKIERFVQNQERPFIAKVYRVSPAELSRNADAPGRIELWWPREDGFRNAQFTRNQF